MIFVTGDTHRMMDVIKIDEDHFREQKLLNRSDYLIIAGDFGGIWTGDSKDDEVLDFHQARNYTTLFVAGNHENYDIINSYPEIDWMGGKIHKLRDNVYHLITGEVFTIDGHKIFIMGGATSVDKVFRQQGISWWAQEEPNINDKKRALTNLAKVGNKVDYIITHTIPEKIRKSLFSEYADFVNYESSVEKFLDVIYENIEYKKWFSGHIHIDRELVECRLRILYSGVVKLR